MSRYAWLICVDCKIVVWLGKAAFTLDGRLEYIHPLGVASEAQKRTLNHVIWKIFADHAGHTLRVITDQDPAYSSLDGYTEVGGEEYGDINFKTYLAGWPGEAP